jgi:hypothetical protein
VAEVRKRLSGIVLETARAITRTEGGAAARAAAGYPERISASARPRR